MAQEKRPFEYPEDLGDSGAGKGMSSFPPGARRAESDFAEEEGQQQEPEQVVSGAESAVSSHSEGAPPRMSDIQAEPTREKYNPREFNEAVEAMHRERKRHFRKSA